jgi:hypothetical protein
MLPQSLVWGTSVAIPKGKSTMARKKSLPIAAQAFASAGEECPADHLQVLLRCKCMSPMELRQMSGPRLGAPTFSARPPPAREFFCPLWQHGPPWQAGRVSADLSAGQLVSSVDPSPVPLVFRKRSDRCPTGMPSCCYPSLGRSMLAIQLPSLATCLASGWSG